jgi:hypothetical protein
VLQRLAVGVEILLFLGESAGSLSRSRHGPRPGFLLVGSVSQPPTAWPVPPARPRPNLSLPCTSKDWELSPEFLDVEQSINATLASGEKSSTAKGPAVRRKDAKR